MLAAYIWPEGLRVKELNLEAIRQALLRADDINLRMLASPRHITMRYEDLSAADDGNQDKASISNASDLPWELSLCATNAVESFNKNKPSNNERRISRKVSSPCKRSKSEQIPEEGSDDEGNEREKGNAVWATGEFLELNKRKKSVCSTSRNCSPERTTRMQHRLGHYGEADVHGFTAPVMCLIESSSFATPISPLVIEIN